MHNEFEGKPEIIFITYDEVIKSPYPFLLNEINTSLQGVYDTFLDLSEVKGRDMGNLLRLCTQRTDRNLFEYLAKREFDYATALKELKDRYFEVYDKSPLLTMGTSLQMLLTQKFTEKVYIYTEEYDIRVHLDIQNTYKDMKRVNYVTGDFGKVLDKLEGITSYILNDLDYIIDILNKDKAEYTNILLASYGYNYVLDEDNDSLDLRIDVEHLIKDRICKFGTFIPAEFTHQDFSQVNGIPRVD